MDAENTVHLMGALDGGSSFVTRARRTCAIRRHGLRFDGEFTYLAVRTRDHDGFGILVRLGFEVVFILLSMALARIHPFAQFAR